MWPGRLRLVALSLFVNQISVVCFLTLHLCDYSAKTVQRRWHCCSLDLKLLLPSPFQTTGPQSSERAPKARGGPVGLAQHGWRGGRGRRRGQNRHAAAPPRGPRTLLLHTEASRRTRRHPAGPHLLVARRRSAPRRWNAAPRVQHY